MMAQTKSAVEQMASLLDKTIRCTMDDGRIVEGNLECIDRLKNIILRDAKERRIVEDASIYLCNHNQTGSPERIIVERRLQQALIPGGKVVKIHLIES